MQGLEKYYFIRQLKGRQTWLVYTKLSNTNGIRYYLFSLERIRGCNFRVTPSAGTSTMLWSMSRVFLKQRVARLRSTRKAIKPCQISE